MKRIDWNQLDAAGRIAALARPQRRTEGFVSSVVREIFDDVRARGGEAVTDWATRLDGAPPRRIEVTETAAAKARRAPSGFSRPVSAKPLPRPAMIFSL